MSRLTLLKLSQITGNEQLNIFKEIERGCSITDFAILTSGFVSDSNFTSSGNELENRTCYWWTSTESFENVSVIAANGEVFSLTSEERHGAVRPAVEYLSPDEISEKLNIKQGKKIREIQIGEYPQTVVNESLSNILEDQYMKDKLIKTDRVYTTDSRKMSDYRKGFEEREHIEYDYSGSKFVRITYLDLNEVKLSSGLQVKQYDNIWVRVEPVSWIADIENNVLLSKKAIVSGIQFNSNNIYDGDFESSDMKKFMDNYLTGDLNLNQIHISNPFEDKSKDSGRKKNPYNFTFDDVSEEDIIKASVESGVSVFLHGRSGEGKSARIKELDPDCEIIYLRNASPDSLNGKSVYNSNTGELIDIPPTWYNNVLKRCEEQPDRIHIVFFDEITNALPSIQGMAFNIVLNREVNGKWKLPDNARIVAAGNDMKDSLAANALAEPLYDRFAHVSINTSVYDWLKWASTPDDQYEKLVYCKELPKRKIHPAIITYIAYKKEEVLRTEFTGERPNADPRKWEMASKMLYKTKNPKTLRALIGEELTSDFTHFCEQQVITLEDVLNDNYTDEDLRINTAEKYATIVGVLGVSGEEIVKVREFAAKLGAEFKTIFDSLWVGDDMKRAKIINDLRASD